MIKHAIRGALLAVLIAGPVLAQSTGANNTTAPGSSTLIGVKDGSGKLQAVSAATPLPITGSISATNPSVGTTGAASPTSATLAGVSDGTNLQQVLAPIALSPTAGVNGNNTVSVANWIWNGTGYVAQPGTVKGVYGIIRDAAGNARGANVTASNALVVDGSGVTQPVLVADGSVVSGSASSATTLSNFPVNVAALGAHSFTMQWTAAGSGNTATYEGNNDNGATWYALNCQSSSVGGINAAIGSAFAVATATPVTCDTGRFTYIRPRISTYGSGTPAATVQFSSVPAFFGVALTSTPTVTISGAGGWTDNSSSNTGGIQMGGKYNATTRNITDTDFSIWAMASNGAGIVRPFATASNTWQATVSLSDTTNTALHASCGAGLKNYVSSLDYSSIAATTAVEVDLNDNTTPIWKANVAAGAGSRSLSWDSPKAGTAATAMNVALTGSPTGAIIVNASGFCAP